MSIFASTDAALAERHRKFVETDFTFEDLTRELLRQCAEFPKGSRARPSFLKRGRKAQGVNYYEATIEVDQSALGPGGKVRGSYMSGGIRTRKKTAFAPRSFCASRRIVKGELKEMAEEALAVILAAKRVAEIFTVMEEGPCSEASTSS